MYYLPIGEAKDYFNFHILNDLNSFNDLSSASDLNFDFNDNLKNIRKAEKTIDKIIFKIPEIDGVQIKLLRVSFNKRTFFPLDCYINYFFKNYVFNYSGPYFITIFKTNNNIFRLITPVYLFIIFFIICFVVYRLIRLSSFRPNFITLENLSKNSKNKPNTNTNFCFFYLSFTKSIAIILICFLIIFSFLFIPQGIYTLKIYWDSYKSYILKGNFSSTYLGFYNIRKFLSFVKENIGKDVSINADVSTSTSTDRNKKIDTNTKTSLISNSKSAVNNSDSNNIMDNINIIVLVKGRPVYIMAEFAYNLYPANIKFINISGKLSQEIINEILKEYKQDLSQNLSQNAFQIKKYTRPISDQNYNVYNKYNISQLNNSQSKYYQYKQQHNYLVILDNNYLKSEDILKHKEFKLIAKYKKDYGLIYAFNIRLYQK